MHTGELEIVNAANTQYSDTYKSYLYLSLSFFSCHLLAVFTKKFTGGLPLMDYGRDDQTIEE